MANNSITTHDSIFIGGDWVAPATRDRIQVISPLFEDVIGSVPSGSEEDVDRAVAAARHALETGPWPAMSLDERVQILKRFRELLLERSEELAQLITSEMGCPITQSRNIQVVFPIRILDAYLETVKTYPFRSVRRSAAGQALVTRGPVGVVAAVVPWNVPVSQTAQKIIPALLTGCTVVLKPAPQTPLDAYFVARLLSEAGLPPGVLNVVPARHEISEYLVGHPDVDKVAFTGSSATGRRIAEICSQDLRRITMELGGKSAAVILEDADIDLAVSALRLGSFRNNGQIWSLKTRILVPSKLEGDFLDSFNAMIDTMPIGDPRDAATEIGPLVSERQRARAENYIASGVAEGARLIRGGGRPSGLEKGWFIEPTVFGGVDPDSTIAQNEIFGPVVSVIPYQTEEEAIAIANNSNYGLSGSVFTTDVDRGMRVAGLLKTGTVELNGNAAGFLAPIGGVKFSGVGRALGPEGIDAYVELKSIGISKEIADSLQ